MHGGRWNEPGTPLVYTSSSLALAQLEALVHFDRSEAPDDLVAVELEVPARIRIEVVEVARLPRGWNRHPAPLALARIGTEWARSLKSAVLRVPSAVVPREPNYLVNPEQADAARVKVIGCEPVRFDERLLPRRRRRRRR